MGDDESKLYRIWYQFKKELIYYQSHKWCCYSEKVSKLDI